MKEMKKKYTKPEMSVYELKSRQTLLTTSTETMTIDDTEYDGTFN